MVLLISAPFFESSREDLSIGMADYWSILKNWEKKAKSNITFLQDALASVFLCFDLFSAAFLETRKNIWPP